jgi:hypothetical protein
VQVETNGKKTNKTPPRGPNRAAVFLLRKAGSIPRGLPRILIQK